VQREKGKRTIMDEIHTPDESYQLDVCFYSLPPEIPEGVLDNMLSDYTYSMETPESEAPPEDKSTKSVRINNNGSIQVVSTVKAPKSRWTLDEIMATDFTDPIGPVTGIIGNGLTILGGRPKLGKSWLLLQLAYAVATGGKFLGKDAKQGSVLYYALEDHPRRLNPVKGAPVEFERILHLNKMSVAQVEKEASTHSLIIIDTLGRAMTGKDLTKDGAKIEEIVGGIQAIAGNYGISIVMSAHTRKPTKASEPNAVDDIMGSTQGLTADPDTVIVMTSKNKNAKTFTLSGYGRDIEDFDITMEFDGQTRLYQSIGETIDIQMTEIEEAILQVVRDLGKTKPSTVAKVLGKNRGNTSVAMDRLSIKGKLRKEIIESYPHYSIPEEPTQRELL
jgi:hypothetical protein